MKKNKKIAPSLYSQIRNYKKYQQGNFWDEDAGQYTDTNPVGQGDNSSDFSLNPFSNPSANGDQDMFGGGDGGGGTPWGMILDKVSDRVDDDNEMTYTGAEIGADVGKVIAGDYTALLDIGKKIVGRGRSRRQHRNELTFAGDTNTSNMRDANTEELETMNSSQSTMGEGVDVDEANLAIQAKKGGMKYRTGGEDTSVSQQDFNRLGVNKYTGALNSEGVYNPDGTFSRLNTDLYGGDRITPENKTWTMDGRDMSGWDSMDATKENIVPMRERMGVTDQQLYDAKYKYTDPNSNPKFSDYRKNFINDNNYRKSLFAANELRKKQNTNDHVMRQNANINKLNASAGYGSDRSAARDASRMERFGNTRSGFSNFFSNIMSKFSKNREGDFAELDGGYAIPIPGSDAVEFKGNRHSENGILDGKSEVEHGETKDGVSSKKHGGAQMPYYFSDYVNTDGSKRYGGNSFADEHKKVLQNGGTQVEIDSLAASQDKAAGRSSNVAGYAQMGGYGNSDDVYDSNFRNKMKYKSGGPIDNTRVSTTNDVDPKGNFVEYRGGNPGDYGSSFWTGKLEADKAAYARNFGKKQEGGMKYQEGDFSGKIYDERRNILLGDYGYDIGQNWDFGDNTKWYDDETLAQFADDPAANIEETVVTPEMEFNRDNNINNTNSGSSSTNTGLQSNNLLDNLGLAASMAAPIAAYTSKPGVMPGIGSIAPVEAEVLKYGNRNDVRARNENDFQKVVQYIKTTGGGPSDMINMMSAYNRKMNANSAVTAEEEKEHINIDNLNADRRQSANQINVANELQMKAFKQDANKTNLLLAEDAKANRIEALQTAAANVVTANRDNKAFEATTLMANAIDGGSGVLGRALTPDAQKQAITDYMENGIVLNSDQVNEQVNASSENPGNPENAVQTVQTVIGTDVQTAQDVVTSNNNMTMASAFLGKNETKHTELLTQIITNYAGTSKIDDPSKTAWCAAFTGSILNMNGYDHKGTASARSFATQGTEVGSDDYQVGDVVVLWRDPKGKYDDSTAARNRSDNANTGHVGFYAGTDADGNILVLGGNQGTAGGGGVTEASFASDRILSVRRFS